MRRLLRLQLLAALALGLVGGAATMGPPGSAVAVEAEASPAEPAPVPMMAAPRMAAPEPQAVEAVEATDPYAGWQAWCEPLDYETRCEKHEDCADIAHVGTRQLRCVHPWWAKWDREYRVCAPGEVMRSERVWRDARMRELVGRIYFDEPEHCPDWTWTALGKESDDGRVRFPRAFRRTWENGKATWEQHWRCTQHTAPAEKLATFLGVVYGRETSRRPWKRHRLNPDLNANKDSWVSQAGAYGWEVELLCSNGKKKCKKKHWVVGNYNPLPSGEHNPHYGERWRWQYGLGGYGKNSALGAQDWDPMAPPEVLCLEVPGTEAYLRDARTAVRKYTSARPPACKGAPYRGRAHSLDEQGEEVWVDRPSWRDVHRVASGGKWCPRIGNGEKRRKFNKRMARAHLDPDEQVVLEDLGQPIPRETQNEVAAAALTEIDAALPPPWRG